MLIDRSRPASYRLHCMLDDRCEAIPPPTRDERQQAWRDLVEPVTSINDNAEDEPSGQTPENSDELPLAALIVAGVHVSNHVCRYVYN